MSKKELDLDPGYYYEVRLLCHVLDEMRACCRTLNFSPLRGLIEEAQIMGNRMEAGLEGKKYSEELHDKIKAGRAELKRLKGEVESLGGHEVTETETKCKSFNELFGR